MAFLGDYIDVAAQTMFASGGTYLWNTGWNAPNCSNKPCRAVFHTAWSDNRDVVVGGAAHTPSNLLIVNPDGSATTVTNAACVPGQNGSRNQNIYTSVISDIAIPYTTNNAKQFNTSTPASGYARGFGTSRSRSTERSFAKALERAGLKRRN